MFRINKISLCSPVDYAAEELKKYLRMMMPEYSEIVIGYEPSAAEGFRLGLMQDFGLDVSDAEDPILDDILYIDTDEQGGIIAGDNPRSVLLAVYEYLRRQGCRWLFPGVDGEFVPVIEGPQPVKYRHKPSCRYRGQCNEGSEYQQNMLEAIEFTPKVGMNVFMMEFRIPFSYYSRYYNHTDNQMHRAPEPITNMTALQWKRQCEAELSRRGLQFHDVGHGWGADSFGIDSALHSSEGNHDAELTDEARQFLALVDGRRGLKDNSPLHTQFCMSNPAARTKVAKYAADYAKRHNNVDYLHLWLADGVNRHCECEECRKKAPSDWYMLLLNELDAELASRNLDTRIVFIVYTDTIWPPETERLVNQKRFTLLFAPFYRSYTQSVPEVFAEAETMPYVRNQLKMPDSLEENFAYFHKWREMWKGANVAYEYHFWRHQYLDMGGTELADVINQDVKAYKQQEVNGVIQDGSQRSFFPTGLVFYTYARTLYDNTLTSEQIAEEYFSCAFGEDWKEFYEYLKALGAAFDFRYLEGELSADPECGEYYAPEHAASLAKVKEITEKGLALIKSHYNMPYRVQTASVRLLEMHAHYAQLLAAALIPKAQGDDEEAERLFEEMVATIGKDEVYFQTCYDHGLAMYSLRSIFRQRTKRR